jgi:trimeric autotransporter adhesin
MRHRSIPFVLSTLLLLSICSAQEQSDNKQTNANQGAPPRSIEGPVIGGDGIANYVPIWRTNNYLLSSVIYQASGGEIGIGTTTPAATLDVNGSINSATAFAIGGNTVLGVGRPSDFNLFLGVEAGLNDLAGQGQYNTFSGYQAGVYNTTGLYNTFSGAFAGRANSTGRENTFSGDAAGLDNTTGLANTFSGYQAGYANTSGAFNTYSGAEAGFSATGGNNTLSGYNAGGIMTTGDNNTFEGANAGSNLGAGSYNSFFGSQAGFNNRTGSSDVYIASRGCEPPFCGESNTIRVGMQGTGDGQQNVTYIAGIYDTTVSGGAPVYVNPNGQLGTSPSSLRFKEQIRNMGESTNGLMQLRPVTFLYKPEYDKGERTMQYGLIAEEVAQVYPELVVYDNNGQPYSVRYQYITTMLLNEVQKQYHRAEAEAKVITAQEQKIDELEQRLSRLESLIPQTVAQK